MDRRRLMSGAVGSIATLAALAVPGGWRPTPRTAAQTPVVATEVEAVGAKLHAGEAVELRQGIIVRFVGVARDNRCPADLHCFVAGSADAVLAFTVADERQNTRTSDEVLEFPLGRKVLVYDTTGFAIVADLSGDSDVDEADLVLSLYLVVTDA